MQAAQGLGMNSILGRHVIATVLLYTALVLLLLLVLGGLFSFIGQQDDIGRGTYTMREALTFVALNMPVLVAQFLPVAALIGALFGLGMLARGSELVVMRASGVTTLQFCGWLGTAGLILVAFLYVVSEHVAPPLETYARQMKTFAKFAEFSFAGNQGAWVRDGNTIISVEQQSAVARFGGVQVFQLDGERRLASVARAGSASVDENNQWLLEDYVETVFGDRRTGAAQMPAQNLRTAISPDFLGLAVAKPDAMRLVDLRAYVAHLERNGLEAKSFEIAYWSRIARFTAVLLMVVLALPFCLGSMRDAGQGARAVIGILLGAGFALLGQTFENSGQLFNVAPVVVGWAPTVLLAVLTVVLLVRSR
jgi:lipopolysaccharide export system permease protein